ncbi:protein TPX2 isoform X1 [Capsicum annuum]|uniref:protein TPX2 isoform X1 n=1 Tax=Capsicum annuum TaxID=4072 RepID=UPI0007BEF9C7|nr:protein TPX2 isoform X1 [Capsicum annuum]
MDEEMEDFIVECSDVYEIDSEYEFDAARFYDFCRPESTSDAEEAERWFQTAGNYLPSPLIIKLNLGKEITAGNSNGCSRLQEGKMAKSKCNNSYIPVGSEVSPSKSKTKGMISKGRTTQEICKIKPEPRSSIARGSTLMKPTASYLAKQRFQSTSNKSDMTSSQNSLASENIGTKRQKLEIGYLLKIAHMKHQRLLSHKISKKDASSISNSIHSKFKVTVPREPELETLQRAQRRSFRCNEDSNSSESTKPKTQMLKAQSLNRNIFKDPTLPPLRKTRAPLPGFDLSNSPNADSAAQNALVDFKRPNTQNAVKQGKSLTSLKSRSHKCNKVFLQIFPSREDNGIGDDTGQESTYSKESKSIFDEKLSVHPPTELLNKLSLRSEKEAREESQPKKNPSAKELKENAPNCLPIKFWKCVGKPNQCAAERGTPRIGHYSSMNRSLGIR